MPKTKIITRRTFVRNGVLGSAFSWTIPSFLDVTLREVHAAQRSDIQNPNGKDAPILVILQLAGGNDGLNTIVPIHNDYYYKARPGLAIRAENTLKINNAFGFNEKMTGFKNLYDKGVLAVIHGVGYPNPNRSHFRSMEIWHTATNATIAGKYGWLGRYFDNQCKGADPSVGISIGQEPLRAFYNKTSAGITFPNARQYKHEEADNDFYGEMNLNYENFEEISIASLGSNQCTLNKKKSPIDFLERIALNAKLSSEKIQNIAKRSYTSGNYPKNKIGNDFKTVAQLIAGEMSTRVYYLSQGGFDTHANQKNAQAHLLEQVSASLKAFMDDMKSQGNDQRVAVMLFSEFGRRVNENSCKGTDHGVAGPMFIIGGAVKSGLHGKMPSLAPRDLIQGDLDHTVDFRSVYATLLEKHLHVPSAPILQKKFPTLDIIL